MWTKEELEKKTKEELIDIIVQMQIDIIEERNELFDSFDFSFQGIYKTKMFDLFSNVGFGKISYVLYYFS